MAIDTSQDHRDELPETEKEFEQFLNQEKINATRQVSIMGCPFMKNKKGEHKVDYLIQRFDGQKIYVEVKGVLSYYAVNQLRYMVEEMLEDVYVYQVTNEDWIKRCKESKKPKDKIAENIKIQKQHIQKFWSGKVSAADLNALTKRYLRAYVRTRNADMKIWRKKMGRLSA